MLAHGGPGGGGSGGNIELWAASITLSDDAAISAVGGFGGGLGTQPYSNDPEGFSDGANGGIGYVTFNTPVLSLAPGATVAAQVVPVPAALPLLLSALAVLGRARRGKA
ncbi:MAG: hypothetical protein ACU85V_15575 [Gammaproteobacteria bacterium]